ncbi:MAG: JAB domain-containing protein [Chitinophagaceae bacterium]
MWRVLVENNRSLFSITEIELTYRNKIKPSERRKITSSDCSYDVFLLAWDMNKIELVEQFMIMLLDRNNTCLGIANLATGGVSACLVDPKVIFATAIKAKASGLIMAHNHPSGSIKPSNADILLTSKVNNGGKILDISVLDHLIITPHAYYSFADEGLMP